MSTSRMPSLRGSMFKVRLRVNIDLPVTGPLDRLPLKVMPAYMHVRPGRRQNQAETTSYSVRKEFYSGAVKSSSMSRNSSRCREFSESVRAGSEEPNKETIGRTLGNLGRVKGPETCLSRSARSAGHGSRAREAEGGTWRCRPVASGSLKKISAQADILRTPKPSTAFLDFDQQEAVSLSRNMPLRTVASGDSTQQVFKLSACLSAQRCYSASGKDLKGSHARGSSRKRWSSIGSAHSKSESTVRKRATVETEEQTVRPANIDGKDDSLNKEREVRRKRAETNDLLADRQVAWFMSLLQQCIRNNKLEKMRFVMKRLSLAQRRQLATFRCNSNSMLFTCCQMGHVDMVNYLLDECGADIEQRGVYEVSGDGSRHMVTPLWCAAVADHVDVVESLIKHGADLNSQSDTGSTPVRSACYMTNIEVVKRLVEAGADIHLPNMNGGTCLINSVQSPELCEFLIRHGARVNDRDKSNNLALHYAIREDRLDTVKLLVEYGSDYNAKNDYNDNALQTAALRGYEDIVEYLIASTRPLLLDIIHAYELLGASFVDERHDIAHAMALWQKAMNLREIGSLTKSLKRERIAAYDFVKEVAAQEELTEAGCDPDNVYMQALLIRERILGKNHKDTSFGVMYRGAVYADSRRFQRCVDLWKYAYHLRFSGSVDPLNHELVFTVQALVKLFWEIHVDETEEGSFEKLRCSDLADTLEELIKHIQAAQVRISKLKDAVGGSSEACKSPAAPVDNCLGYFDCACGKHREGSIEDFCLLMQLSVHLIFLFSAQPDVTEDLKHCFYTLVYQLLKADPRTSEGESLLHLALTYSKTNLSPDFCLKPLPVVKILLECGADADALTKTGQTPLLYCLQQEVILHGHSILFNREKQEDLIHCLLQHGAHADRSGHLPLLHYIKASRSFFVLDHVNLQCLAAQAVRTNGVVYKGMLPASLEKFVEMH